MGITETKDVCRITLTFRVDSDEAAIEYKKKIAAIMSGLDEVQIQFSLMNIGKPNERV